MPVNSFKWKHFAGEIILQTIRWYLKYSSSYRNLEEMIAERRVEVDHTTIMRWVHQYSPEIEKKVRRYLKPTNDSWRVDETYIKGFCCKNNFTAFLGYNYCFLYHYRPVYGI